VVDPIALEQKERKRTILASCHTGGTRRCRSAGARRLGSTMPKRQGKGGGQSSLVGKLRNIFAEPEVGEKQHAREFPRRRSLSLREKKKTEEEERRQQKEASEGRRKGSSETLSG